jgi:hypothetical protein
MRTETLPLKGTEDLQPSEGVSKTERDRERETSKLVPGLAKPIFGQVGQALQLTGPVSAVFIAGTVARDLSLGYNSQNQLVFSGGCDTLAG